MLLIPLPSLTLLLLAAFMLGVSARPGDAAPSARPWRPGDNRTISGAVATSRRLDRAARVTVLNMTRVTLLTPAPWRSPVISAGRVGGAK